MSRLKQLQKLAEAQPDDPLAHYGVGLECMQLELWTEALEAFERTLSIDAHYAAAYTQKARVQLKLGQREAAKDTVRTGVNVARAAGDVHTAGEMEKTLESLS